MGLHELEMAISFPPISVNVNGIDIRTWYEDINRHLYYDFHGLLIKSEDEREDCHQYLPDCRTRKRASAL